MIQFGQDSESRTPHLSAAAALPYVPADTANAASWLQRLELRLPCLLFAEGPHSLTPMSHGTVDRFLGLLLRPVLPEAEAKKYSFHSFRVGFACALLAAGCPPATLTSEGFDSVRSGL